MDEARIDRLIAEIETTKAEFLNRPDNVDMNYLSANLVILGLQLHELINLRLIDLQERVFRIEAAIDRLSPSDRTESPPAQP